VRVRSSWGCLGHNDDIRDAGKSGARYRRAMAIYATTGNSGMVHLPARETREAGERRVNVTGAAQCRVASGQMVTRHAWGLVAVVAGGTSACISTQCGVIKAFGRCKSHRRVTNVARQIGGDVIRRLSLRSRAIVASSARTRRDIRVIEEYGRK
jgi:hypothetical protein